MGNSLDLIKVGGECLGALAEDGIEVEMITDFVLAEQMTEAMGKPGLTPKLSSRYNDFTEESGLWLFMREEGEYIVSLAARYDNVGRESMREYMMRTMDRHYPNEDGQTLLDFTHALPPGFYGRMAYIGELFVRPDRRGSRQRLRYLMMLMHTCIAAKWPVDWIYAMMRDRDVRAGFATNYGFTIQLPGVARWAQPVPQGRGDTEWLVALPEGHLSHMMHHYSRSLESL
ncbi:hypothetical protein [Roseovarius sp. EL26]|uniref:hypothetical protein n=1 Tax=Roseovarius sp. EL26 TaxID=2126672 RepID=UPI000EA24448|nr:hypothetical protein [Roseovarius sp. EL26]